MKREQLEHVLRIAAKVADDPEVLVVGSQSILGTFTEDQLPYEAVASIEVDVAFLDDPGDAKADLVDAQSASCRHSTRHTATTRKASA